MKKMRFARHLLKFSPLFHSKLKMPDISRWCRIRYFNNDSLSRKQETIWESVVGLEIHAQVNAQSKLFSSAGTDFGAPTNSQVAFFDASIPGTLPVCNRGCVEAGVLTALALNCTINKSSSFDRKHYFYSDLPSGYQITQQFHPLATDGYLEVLVFSMEKGTKPYKLKVRLKQLQLEQDSGRSFHIDGRKTLIDLNRAGVGLMELVFEPDLKNGTEASALVRELHLILTKLNTCSCVMEEGALRVDANISVNKRGEPWGVRTEVKNINSFKCIANAIDYEISRQIHALEDGQSISNETRHFDFKSKETVFMRDKEVFQDYRFFPEPNLPPLRLCDNSDEQEMETEDLVNIDKLKERIPLLPSQERELLVTTYNLSLESADRVVAHPGLFELFKKISEPHHVLDNLAIFLLNKVQCQLNQRKQTFQTCTVSPNHLKEVFDLIQSSSITEATANDVLEIIFNGDTRSAKEIVDVYNWSLINDVVVLEETCKKVMLSCPKVVKKYRNTQGKKQMTSLLAGLNYKLNNRAAIKLSESIFIRLIMDDPSNKET